TQNEHGAQQQRREIRQRRRGNRLPTDIDHAQMVWEQSFAEVEPDVVARFGEALPETDRLENVASKGLIFLEPRRHQSKAQREEKERRCVEQILTREPSALPGCVTEQH